MMTTNDRVVPKENRVYLIHSQRRFVSLSWPDSPAITVIDNRPAPCFPKTNAGLLEPPGAGNHVHAAPLVETDDKNAPRRPTRDERRLNSPTAPVLTRRGPGSKGPP
jgi:hypothetical protein